MSLVGRSWQAASPSTVVTDEASRCRINPRVIKASQRTSTRKSYTDLFLSIIPPSWTLPGPQHECEIILRLLTQSYPRQLTKTTPRS